VEKVWSDAEDYRALEQRYNLALEEYNRASDEYAEAQKRSEGTAALEARYAQLSRLKARSDELWKQLMESRGRLASARESALRMS
jgi:hypothetical protein